MGIRGSACTNTTYKKEQYNHVFIEFKIVMYRFCAGQSALPRQTLSHGGGQIICCLNSTIFCKCTTAYAYPCDLTAHTSPCYLYISKDKICRERGQISECESHMTGRRPAEHYPRLTGTYFGVVKFTHYSSRRLIEGQDMKTGHEIQPETLKK